MRRPREAPTPRRRACRAPAGTGGCRRSHAAGGERSSYRPGRRPPWRSAAALARRARATRTCRTAGHASRARADGSPPRGRRDAPRASRRPRRPGPTRRSRPCGARRSSREPARAVRQRPSSPGDPWPRTRARIPRARPCRYSRGRLRGSAVSAKRAAACSTIAGEQMRFGEEHERGVSPGAPRRAPASTATRASANICSGPAAHMTARNMARAESNDALPSSGHLVERGGIGDRRPPLAVRRLPGQDGDPARRARRAAGRPGCWHRSSAREPSLDRRHLSDAVGGKH